MYKLVFLDHTTQDAPGKPKDYAAGIQAMGELLEKFAESDWGAQDVGFRVGADANDRQEGEIAVNNRDTLPEAPGALAYHQVTNGIPDIEMGCDLFTSEKDGPESYWVAFGHELLEMLGDPGANEWAMRDDGLEEALEAVDYVQNLTWQASNGVSLPHFVYRRKFTPGSEGPWDSAGAMKTPYDASNGYTILSTAGEVVQDGAEQQQRRARKGRRSHVNPEALHAMTEGQRARKRLSYRLQRRGVRLPPQASPPRVPPKPPASAAKREPTQEEIFHPPSAALQALAKLKIGQ